MIQTGAARTEPVKVVVATKIGEASTQPAATDPVQQESPNMPINLLLDEVSLEGLRDGIDATLIDLMVEHGIRFDLLGTREIDDSLTETIWTAVDGPSAHIRLFHDTEMPALWIAVESVSDRVTQAMATACQRGLPVRSFEALCRDVREGLAGSLPRLALTHDLRLAQVLPSLVDAALQSSAPARRLEAAMASQMASIPGLRPLLVAALERETDPDLATMIEFAISKVP